MEGCSETEIIKFEKVGCLQAQFGLGAAFGPWDFKSTMSTYSIIAAYASLKKRGMESWRDVLEGCSKFPKFQIQKARISLALFKVGA